MAATIHRPIPIYCWFSFTSFFYEQWKLLVTDISLKVSYSESFVFKLNWNYVFLSVVKRRVRVCDAFYLTTHFPHFHRHIFLCLISFILFTFLDFVLCYLCACVSAKVRIWKITRIKVALKWFNIKNRIKFTMNKSKSQKYYCTASYCYTINNRKANGSPQTCLIFILIDTRAAWFYRESSLVFG